FLSALLGMLKNL
uniref:Venom peptide PPM3 n=1 Tax=Polistes major TaxID=91420 RepID=VP3_POLMJ|nr:RecName: Full=Venom peptide PPM3 [Polistes major]